MLAALQPQTDKTATPVARVLSGRLFAQAEAAVAREAYKAARPPQVEPLAQAFPTRVWAETAIRRPVSLR